MVNTPCVASWPSMDVCPMFMAYSYSYMWAWFLPSPSQHSLLFAPAVWGIHHTRFTCCGMYVSELFSWCALVPSSAYAIRAYIFGLATHATLYRDFSLLCIPVLLVVLLRLELSLDCKCSRLTSLGCIYLNGKF